MDSHIFHQEIISVSVSISVCRMSNVLERGEEGGEEEGRWKVKEGRGGEGAWGEEEGEEEGKRSREGGK